MTIPIIREPIEHTRRFRETEACCFCHQPTVYWTALPRRKPGAQVACCSGCAGIFPAYLVPTKDEWWDYHASQRPEAKP